MPADEHQASGGCAQHCLQIHQGAREWGNEALGQGEMHHQDESLKIITHHKGTAKVSGNVFQKFVETPQE